MGGMKFYTKSIWSVYLLLVIVPMLPYSKPFTYLLNSMVLILITSTIFLYLITINEILIK